MIPSLLMGAVAGARSMTPLAAVSLAASRGALPAGSGAPRLLARPAVAAGATALAVGELLGDKLKSAPDRIVAAGLAARIVTGAVAAASLAPRRRRWVAGALGAAAAVAASYPTWALRMRGLRRHGQTPTGLAEDALVIAAALAIVMAVRPRR